jgi:hypothetical protein
MPNTVTPGGQTTMPSEMKISTEIGKPIEIIGAISNSTSYKSRNEFIVSVAKDIFYSRDLQRKTADALAIDAVYCAKRFVRILEKEKLIEFNS